ncbi:MAG: PEP-CTERM sorting domain-containing protein [Verrucomicrobiaceae bacterium]|nr:MAG: PEP-CTERM sorting domain-containing protein [Verrucomicrobiaceae bacterium]
MKSQFLWLTLLGTLPNIACATMVLQADSGADSYSFSWSGGDMLKTPSLGRPWQPYYMITLHFDPSFANVGMLRLDTTDGFKKTFEWDLSSTLNSNSSIVAYDLHQGGLAGHLELNMISGNAKITSITIQKVVEENVPGFPTSHGRGYQLDINPVPEPAAGALVGCALLGLGFRRWRTRHQDLT